MLRTALFAVLLTGLASTAMASDRDRVRVVVSYDSGGYGYYHAGDRYYGRDRGYDYRYDRRYDDRDYRRGGRYYGHDRRWDRGRYYGDRRYDGRRYGWGSYYYSRPYYYYGYGHSRYCPDRWHRH